MNHNYKWAAIALVLCLPFCGSQKSNQQLMSISSKEISLAVELDILQLACERKLSALEADTTPKAKKRAPMVNIRTMTASEPVHYKPKK